MKYQIINEKLKIASCSIADLTLEQAQQFLKQWEEGAKLGTLTVFYEREAGLLVINRDNAHYQDYLEIAEAYLPADKETRIRLRKEAPSEITETMKVLEHCIQERIGDKFISQAIKNNINPAERKLIEMTINRQNPISAVFTAFKLGVIRGKRIERAKKKRGTAA